MRLKKEVVSILAILLFSMLSFLANSTSIVNIFSNSMTTENLTFTGNENITRYINISKYANVSSAYLTLSYQNQTAKAEILSSADDNILSQFPDTFGTGTDSSILINKDDYGVRRGLMRFSLSSVPDNSSITHVVLNVSQQLNPNGAVNLTAYFMTNDTWSEAQSWNSAPSYSNFLGSVSIPVGSDHKYFSLDFSSNSFNLTQQQFDTDEYLSLNLRLNDESTNANIALATREDTQSGGYKPYLYVDYNQLPHNSFIEVAGTTIWSFSGILNQTNNRTEDFYSSIVSALNNGACDCTGCILTGNTCSIPIIFHSDTAGIIQYSDLNVSYNIKPTVDNISISPSTAYNNDDLNCTFTITDLDGNDISANVSWYNGATLYGSYNISANQGVQTSNILKAANTSIGETWNCSVIAYDSIAYSASNSTTKYINSSLTINLFSPDNASYSSIEKLFECNASSIAGRDDGLYNITLYVWRSNNSLYNDITTNFTAISGYSNSSKWNITFDASDTYHWNCISKTNMSYEDWANTNNTLTVDISSPITTINYPQNRWLNKMEVDFNCTTESAYPSGAFLYGNFTGTYELNQTLSGITSGVQYNFKINLTDGSYLYTCAANKSTDAAIIFSQYGNYTLSVDTIYPTIILDNITTTAGSQTISFSSTSNDTNTIACKYSIYDSLGAIDGLNANVSFTCNSLGSATVTAYGSYNMTITTTDLASNSASSTLAFTTSASLGTVVVQQGGNAPTPTPLVCKNQTLEIRPETFTYYLLPNQNRNFYFELYNMDLIDKTLTFSCDDTTENTTSNVCQYVNVSQSITIPPNPKQSKLTTFNVVTPPEADFGDVFYFNILMDDGAGCIYQLPMENKISIIGVAPKMKTLSGIGGFLLGAIIGVIFMVVLGSFSKRFYLFIVPVAVLLGLVGVYVI